MGRRSISEDRAELEWETGVAGCLVPLAVGMALMLLYWGVNPGAESLQELDGRGSALIRTLASSQAGGRSWWLLILYACVAWYVVQLVWRVVERVAVSATPTGLRMHGMFGRWARWEAVESVRLVPDTNRTMVEIVFRAPQPGLFLPLRLATHRIAALNLDDGAGERFVEAAERWRMASG